jgi:hypothetical protein
LPAPCLFEFPQFLIGAHALPNRAEYDDAYSDNAEAENEGKESEK